MKDSGSVRDPAAGPDPSRLFLALKRHDPPEEFWIGFWPSVRAGIRDARLRRDRILTRGRVLLLGSAAGAMAAAAVVAMTFLFGPAARIPAPPERLTPVPAGIHPAGEAGPPPVLEDLSSTSARVYTFQVGEATEATDVILIVDETIDI